VADKTKSRSSGRAASASRESDDAIYDRLVEEAPEGILVVRNGKIAFLNATAKTLFGEAANRQLSGKPFLDCIHRDCQPNVREVFAQVEKRHQPHTFETRIANDPHAPTDIEAVAMSLGDDRGAILVMVRDITERKRADAALRASEERLTLAFAGAQEGVWDWDLETGSVVYSRRWKEMLGYDDQEVEPHVTAWERLLHPDDIARAKALNERVRRGDEPTYQGEFRLRHKDGRYIDVLTRGFPVHRGSLGPVVRIVGTHLDLTERKRAEAVLRESEERLRLAFDGAQEGVWDWNLETDAVVYSPRWRQMLGYGDDEIEPHVSAWERLVHPDDRTRADRAHERVVQGDPTYEAEFRLRHKDGHYVHVLSRGYPVRRQPEGNVVRIVGTHFDLSERKRAEETLRRAHEELEIRVRERTAELARVNASLLAEMAERERVERARLDLHARLVFAQEDERRRIAREMHDQFGEQLTALGLRIGTLKTACSKDAELAVAVEALEEVAQRLDRDVDELVWKLRPTALDDLGLGAALANYVKDWSRRASVPVEFHTSGLEGQRLPSETETTLYRIAQEALTNVAKHSRARKVDVILERRADQVLLVIEDNGIGFEQPDASEPGQGFGLLGMKERAALVGASLQIESEVGRGTTILVRMAAAAPAGNQTTHA
jgi:PAS domain S-box-containing protein